MDFGPLIETYGLLGVFIGTTFDGEAVSLIGGIFAHHGYFRPETVALVATAGGIVTDHAYFLLGRVSRRHPRVQRILEHRHWQKLGRRIDARPVLMIVLARFLYGIHGVATMMIGAHGVRWSAFALINAAAVASWAHLWTWLGYAAGRAIERMFGRVPVHVLLFGGLGLLVLFILAAGVIRHRRAD